MNNIIITGNLGKNAEKSQYGVKFTVATTRNYTDKNGQKAEKTSWHNVNYLGRNEAVASLKKGQRVCVIGEYETGSYKKQDGTTANFANLNSFEVYVEPRVSKRNETPDEDLPDFMR